MVKNWFENIENADTSIKNNNLHTIVVKDPSILDQWFGEWRKITKMLNGTENDGYFALESETVKLTYNEENYALCISFIVGRYNCNGSFIG